MVSLSEGSLLSIDVGFSVKDQELPVNLPIAQIYKIKYEDKYSRSLMAAGDWEKISKTLKKAGYKCVQVENNL